MLPLLYFRCDKKKRNVVELNFAGLRTGFSNYLEELYLKEGRELTSTSIFAHSDEFERYVSDELNNAKNAVEVAQQDVVAVKELINDNENRNLSLEYSSNFVGRDIAQFALEFLGYNEADASADIFLEKWHSSSSQTGWCAAFVSYIYEHMPSSDKIPQWYKDIENQYWQVNVHRAAEEAGAIIDSSQAETGDIVLYDYDGDGTMQHIGIVLAVEGNKLITIDGNSGNTVRINEVDLEHPATCPLTFCKIT